MPIKILMPALSPTMTEGNLAKWLKKEGDNVRPGEVIAEIETDKATMEVEAVDEGIIAKIIVPEGTENVKVNSLIAVLLEEGEDKSNLDSVVASTLITETPPVPTLAPTIIPSVVTEQLPHTEPITDGKSSRVFASPLAKRLALLSNINLDVIKGSGPHGRIVKQDVISASSKHEIKTNNIVREEQEYTTVPNNNIRKIIARRLQESKQTIPHFYLSIECNVDKLLDAREDINRLLADDKIQKISVNDFIILAAAKALKEVPAANASWEEAAIRYYNNVDISVAVAIENGLITPIIKNADQKDIKGLSLEMKELIKRARDHKLAPEEFQGGSFSISNLGMYGIKHFSAIINPPQSCILAVGTSVKRPIIQSDQIKIATMMDVSLSADHRVVDGAVGAKYLAAFKKYIESPVLMLV